MQQSYETILIYQKRREPCWTLSLSREAEGFPECIRDDEVDECLVILRGEGYVKLDVRLENDTVWLTQEQLSNLFHKSLSTINYHISVGYRVKSIIGTRFRQTKEETLFHQACTLLPFKIGSFSSIDDLLGKLGVCIQIAPGIKYHVVPSELLKERDYWEKELKKWKEGSLEYNEIWDILLKIRDEISAWKAFQIRGEYLHEDKIIRLYPEEMRKECDSDGGKHLGLSIYSLLVSTLAHESMHAYFDRTVLHSLHLFFLL